MKMQTQMTNVEVAELLRAVAAVYEILQPLDKRFEIIAYNEAADSIEQLGVEVRDIWQEDKLVEIPGVGKRIAGYLDELFRTGQVETFTRILKRVPPAIFPLLRLSGIGPKRALKLVQALKIHEENAIPELQEAAEKGLIAQIPTFGETSQQAILKAIEEYTQRGKRYLLSYAWTRAEDLIHYLKEHKDVETVEVLGSLRRKAPTVGDIDMAVVTNNPDGVIAYYRNYPHVKRVLEEGPRKAAILLPGEIRADLRVQQRESFGSLLQHFTGSKQHNITLRAHAQKKGWSLSEYGIKKDGTTYTYDREEAFYKALGMDWIPPELREDRGEIEAALRHELPKLVELKDIRADLQMHTNFDIETSHDLGASSMDRHVEMANKLGYEYIAFTEHNPSQTGHTEKDMLEILKRKAEAVARINESLGTGSLRKVFNSLEIDILPNGSLPVTEAALDLLDFALVSIHSSFRQSREPMTNRVLQALKHPKVKIFAHPTGRKLMEREGVELDWDEVFAFVIREHKWIEINADPSRLDLPETLVHEAVKQGVLLTIGTDAHEAKGMENMRYGVEVARRGWAEKKDIVNTWTLSEFEKLLNR